VNLEFGKHMDWDDTKNIRFHGGGQYGRINIATTGSANIISNQSNTPRVYTETFGSDFSGFGPRLGFDINYKLAYGLSIYANGAGTALVGTSDFNRSFQFDQAVGSGFIESSATGSKRMIVPELEGKLGAAFTCNIGRSHLILDAGWMWLNYFNVVRSSDTAITTQALSESANTPVAARIVSSNFALQGLNFGLKWVSS
jgi:hypothetical protein